jgi:hypothetical protein
MMVRPLGHQIQRHLTTKWDTYAEIERQAHERRLANWAATTKLPH